MGCNMKNKPGRACCDEASSGCTDYVLWATNDGGSGSGNVFNVYLNDDLLGATDDWEFASPRTIYVWTSSAELAATAADWPSGALSDLVPIGVPASYVLKVAVLPDGVLSADSVNRLELRYKRGGVADDSGLLGVSRAYKSGGSWLPANGGGFPWTQAMWSYDYQFNPDLPPEALFFSPCFYDIIGVRVLGCGFTASALQSIVSLLENGAVVDQQVVTRAAPVVWFSYPFGADKTYDVHVASPSGRFLPFTGVLDTAVVGGSSAYDVLGASGVLSVRLVVSGGFHCLSGIQALECAWPARDVLHYSSPQFGSGTLTYGSYSALADVPAQDGWGAWLTMEYPGETTGGGVVICPPVSVPVLIFFTGELLDVSFAATIARNGPFVFSNSCPAGVQDPAEPYQSGGVFGGGAMRCPEVGFLAQIRADYAHDFIPTFPNPQPELVPDEATARLFHDLPFETGPFNSKWVSFTVTE